MFCILSHFLYFFFFFCLLVSWSLYRITITVLYHKRCTVYCVLTVRWILILPWYSVLHHHHFALNCATSRCHCVLSCVTIIILYSVLCCNHYTLFCIMLLVLCVLSWTSYRVLHHVKYHSRQTLTKQLDQLKKPSKDPWKMGDWACSLADSAIQQPSTSKNRPGSLEASDIVGDNSRKVTGTAPQSTDMSRWP